MKTIFGMLILLISISSHASTGGALFINSDNTKAMLVINEGMEDGNLSKLYDQMKIQESGENSKKKKSFQMSNDRFSLICSKAIFISSPPSTSCTFVIKAGPNTAEVNTSISKISGKKLANIDTTQILSKEFDGLFPTDTNGSIDYLLKLDNGVALEVNGASSGNLTIGFSAQ